MRYWERASKQNVNIPAKAWANLRLGKMYAQGEWVTKDLDQAADYYRKARLFTGDDEYFQRLLKQGLNELEQLKKKTSMDQADEYATHQLFNLQNRQN